MSPVVRIVIHYISIDRNVMKDIKPILHTLGLLDSEIKTYLAALEHGPGTAIDLTKTTKLSRQAVYVAIETLTKRGIMSSVEHGKKTFYAAEHPSKLLAYARRREAEMKEHIQDLERSVPELELQIGGERPVVKVYEGKEGIRAIIEDMRTELGGVHDEIADVTAMNRILSAEDLTPLRQALKKAGAKFQGLYSGQTSLPIVTAERYQLPPELGGFQSNITLYGDKVAMVTFHGKMHSVVIESKELAKALHVLFTLAYETAKKKFKGL